MGTASLSLSSCALKHVCVCGDNLFFLYKVIDSFPSMARMNAPLQKSIQVNRFAGGVSIAERLALLNVNLYKLIHIDCSYLSVCARSSAAYLQIDCFILHRVQSIIDISWISHFDIAAAGVLFKMEIDLSALMLHCAIKMIN